MPVLLSSSTTDEYLFPGNLLPSPDVSLAFFLSSYPICFLEGTSYAGILSQSNKSDSGRVFFINFIGIVEYLYDKVLNNERKLFIGRVNMKKAISILFAGTLI